METYASELLSEDTGKPDSLELQEKSHALGAELSEATAFLRPEVLKLGRAKVDELLKGDKSLAIYAHAMDDIVRMAPHTLDARGESIVATFELSSGAAGNTWRAPTARTGRSMTTRSPTPSASGRCSNT